MEGGGRGARQVESPWMCGAWSEAIRSQQNKFSLGCEVSRLSELDRFGGVS